VSPSDSLGEPHSHVTQNTKWPNGNRFAFTIIDDTDTVKADTEKAALDRIRPVYDLLLEYGLKTTKTVWIMPGEKSRGCDLCLQNDKYLQWILDLRDKGVEIAIHGVAGKSSTRGEIVRALDFYRQVFGEYPSIHTNHVGNLDNLYWYQDRLVGAPALAYRAYNLVRRGRRGRSLGHKESSEYFWGNICRERISYVRNFTFRDVNTLRNDPWMPFHSPRHPFVREWFSASEGADLGQFVRLVSEPNQDRLMEERGACIAYTHFAFGFVRNGKVDPEFRALIRRLSQLPGYFVPVTKLLSHLKGPRAGQRHIQPKDLARLQRRWLRDRLLPT